MKLPFENSENYRRLLAMIDPKQDKWDLSPNDVKAISWAVDALRLFAERSLALEKPKIADDISRCTKCGSMLAHYRLHGLKCTNLSCSGPYGGGRES